MPGRLQYCFRVARVCPATAEVPREGPPHLLFRRVGVPVEEGLGRDDEAGSTVAALRGVPFHVSMDERVSGCGYPLDGLYRLAFTLYGKGHAREHGPSVHDHRARAALSVIAERFGRTRETEPVEERPLERPMRLYEHFTGLAVH